MKHVRARIVICGASLGGTVAAMSAAKSGKKVILFEKTGWIGGQLTSQAVPPDENPWIEYGGSSGSYQEYRRRVRERYLKDENFLDEVKAEGNFCPADSQVSFLSHPPKLALEILGEMLEPYVRAGNLSIILNAELVGADAADGIIKSVTYRTEEGEIKAFGEIFLDGTDTGELLALSGLPYRTGAEARSETGESRAPEMADPFDMQPAVYTAAIENRLRGDFVIEKPELYDYFKKLKSPYGGAPVYSMYGPDSSTGRAKLFGMYDGERDYSGEELFPLYEYRRIIRADNYLRGVPYDVTLVNWPQNDYFLGNIFGEKNSAEHDYMAKQLTLGFIYWLQTEAPRADGGKGYPYFCLNGGYLGTDDGLSMAPYIRESRRIIPEFLITEDMIAKGSDPQFYDSVGIGSYPIDVHVTTRSHTFFYEPTERFTIPLGALITKKRSNLIPACKNIGTTHITNGSYRLHPIEWNIGESAGYLAVYALEEGIEIAEVRADKKRLEAFQTLLRENGVRLDWNEINIEKISIKGKTKARKK
ncbi:MAG: FAD-dependent oxidoreductase [Ruminococcus flavefaciens]|nr:FAD-dependent oxidoreductase [Ruminococcus flavefaciens]